MPTGVDWFFLPSNFEFWWWKSWYTACSTLVSYAAVLCLVTQRSSPRTAAENTRRSFAWRDKERLRRRRVVHEPPSETPHTWKLVVERLGARCRFGLLVLVLLLMLFFFFASKPLTIYSVPWVIFVALATASESPFLFHVGIYSLSFRCPYVFIYFFIYCLMYSRVHRGRWVQLVV